MVSVNKIVKLLDGEIGKKLLLSVRDKWIHEAACDLAVLKRQFWEKLEKESLATLRKADVMINYSDKKSFIERVQPLLETYKSNTVVYSYVKRIRAVE